MKYLVSPASKQVVKCAPDRIVQGGVRYTSTSTYCSGWTVSWSTTINVSGWADITEEEYNIYKMDGYKDVLDGTIWQ